MDVELDADRYELEVRRKDARMNFIAGTVLAVAAVSIFVVYLGTIIFAEWIVKKLPFLSAFLLFLAVMSFVRGFRARSAARVFADRLARVVR